MRLRYLHLPDYGPLQDLAIVFGQEPLVERKGALNFIVGVNGSGKSSLLRAVFETFQHLERGTTPPFPITLVYDWGAVPGPGDTASDAATIVVHCPPGKSRMDARIRVVRERLNFRTTEEWKTYVRDLPDTGTDVVAGDQLLNNMTIQQFLPTHVIAYTSGDSAPWEISARQRREPDFAKAAALDEADPDERPAYWTERHEIAAGGTKPEGPENIADTEPLRCVLLKTSQLHLAALTMAVVLARKEMAGPYEGQAWQKFRADCLDRLRQNRPSEGLRSILQELDWLHPTHISLTLNPEAAPADGSTAPTELLLDILATRVIRQPSGRVRYVVDLGPRSEPKDASAKAVAKIWPDKDPPQAPLDLADRIDRSETGAQAFLRLFSIQSAPWPLFESLQAWSECGLLEDIELTVKRIRPFVVNEGNTRREEDSVIPFRALSDGEQMLLGRISLLFLIQHMGDSLLLLDEPETHFNDVWKRDIVHLLNENLLRDTPAQVLVSTHSSIALSDVFRSEAVLLKKNRETAAVYEANEPIETYAAAPSEIMRSVLGAVDTVGTATTTLFDLILVAAAHRKAMERAWSKRAHMKAEYLPRAFWRDLEMIEYAPFDRGWVASTLDVIRAKGREAGARDFVSALHWIEQRMGPGHFQFELQRRLDEMEGQDDGGSTPCEPEPLTPKDQNVLTPQERLFRAILGESTQNPDKSSDIIEDAVSQDDQTFFRSEGEHGATCT